ncbi:MAG: hypothetical protein ACRDOH_21745 [Streptosporangiaceae bacterium]
MTQTADPAPKIRRYREADLGAHYDICVRTADAGRYPVPPECTSP